MGRIVTITGWDQDHNVPSIAVNGGEFVIPFNTATTIPDAHFAVLQAMQRGNPKVIKFTDGGSTGEPAASLTTPVPPQLHRTR